jgi:hypothetical protein
MRRKIAKTMKRNAGLMRRSSALTTDNKHTTLWATIAILLNISATKSRSKKQAELFVLKQRTNLIFLQNLRSHGNYLTSKPYSPY